MSEEIIIEEFFERLDKDMKSGDTDETLMYIIRLFDDLMLGNMALVDKILLRVNVDELNEDLLVALLSFTFVAKDELPSRADLYDRAKEKLEKDTGESDLILQGLE
jgi:hypothetical protein